MEEAEKLIDKAADNELAKKEAAKVKKILDDAKKEINNSKNIDDIKKAKERNKPFRKPCPVCISCRLIHAGTPYSHIYKRNHKTSQLMGIQGIFR